MTKDIYIDKNGPFSIPGGVLVIGDINAYRLVVDMGTDASHMTAMAVCQENGEFSSNFKCIGSRIFVTLENSMYKKEGYITIRLAISSDDTVLTAKEIVFRVVASNNADTIAETQSGSIENILTSVQKAAQEAEKAAESAMLAISAVDSKADTDDVYTKDEIDSICIGRKTKENGEIFNDYERNTAGTFAHAEGYMTNASGPASHAEGLNTFSEGECSHAGGNLTHSNGMYSFAHGTALYVEGISAAAFGEYNDNSSDDLFNIGNGTSNSARSNAFTVKRDGTIIIPGCLQAISEKAICDGNGKNISSTYAKKVDVNQKIDSINSDIVNINQKATLLSNALTGKISGEGIRLDDVSPIEHDIKIKVIGDAPETISLLQYDKNIYNAGTYVCNMGNGTLVEQLSNGVVCQGSAGNATNPVAYSNGWAWFSAYAINLTAGIPYTISADYTVLETGEGRTGSEPVSISLRASSSITNTTSSKHFSEMPEVGKTVRMYMTYVVNENGIYYPQFSLNSNKVRIENIQVEIGKAASPYEPYKAPITLKPDANGVVEGIKSGTSSMTFTTDTPGAIITCEYIRDINKVIENLTNAIISLGGNV